MWDVLWWILGCTLAALGFYNAPGSGSGRPLGAEREPMASLSDRYTTSAQPRKWGLGSLKYAFYISYMYISQTYVIYGKCTKTLGKPTNFMVRRVSGGYMESLFS